MQNYGSIDFFSQFHTYLVLLFFTKVVILELGYPPVPLAALGLEMDITIM